MKRIFYMLLFLCALPGYAQQTCDCQRNFDEMYQKVKDNYAGWSLKVQPGNQADFDALSASVRTRSKGIGDPAVCLKVLNEWLAFFRDGHLFINTQIPVEEAEPPQVVSARAAAVSLQRYTSEQVFTAYLTAGAPAAVEGVWESDDQSYRLGIVRDEKKAGVYYGFLLVKRDQLWLAGKTKFVLNELSPGKFRTTYYYADFTKEETLSRLVKNVLVMEGIYRFSKVFPIPQESVTEDEIQYQIRDYRVQKLDDRNTLITLPPFTLAGADLLIEDLVKRNQAVISGSENLIIDLRNNPGGDENVFTPLFPFIAQGDIVRKGGKFRATQENLLLLRHELKAIQSYPQFRETLEPKLRQVVRRVEENLGKTVDGPDKIFSFPAQTGPKKVVILVNKNTASTAESLCLEARQSRKTILMGENTKGLADFIEVRDLGMPCFGWRLAYALAVSPRLPEAPIDNIGIKPDVIIPDNEYDWVEYARKYLNDLK